MQQLVRTCRPEGPHPSDLVELSINVHKADASRDKGIIKVFVELRDERFSGSTYHLAYDSQKDLLTGIYNHAGLLLISDVIFRRMRWITSQAGLDQFVTEPTEQRRSSWKINEQQG